MSSVEKFYDSFSSNQEATGINLRHKTIDKWCTKFELKSSDKVLEIGCGIGTQTELLSNRITDGCIDAYDISPKSIEMAKKRLQSRPNINFYAADITQVDLKKDFYDFVLLPDVLEHIPIDVHDKLFERISYSMKSDAKVLIHIPDPYHNQWISIHKPERQQIIDQNLFLPLIAKPIYDADLCIEYLETYDLHANNGDYQVIVLRKVRDKDYSPVIRSKTLVSKIIWKVKSILTST